MMIVVGVLFETGTLSITAETKVVTIVVVIFLLYFLKLYSVNMLKTFCSLNQWFSLCLLSDNVKTSFFFEIFLVFL